MLEPFGGPPGPPAPKPPSGFATPPDEVSQAAGVTDESSVTLIASEIQAKIPSTTLSPRKTYCTNGSMSSASWRRI